MTSRGLKPTLSRTFYGTAKARALIRTHSWIGWGAFWIILSAVDPCAAMIQASQEPQRPVAQSSPTPAANTPPTQSSPTATPQPSPSLAVPPTIVGDAVHPPSPHDEIVITAVGDVMLGTTFPDESTLPPNDGADLLTEVTPFLKRGDVVIGNLEGPLVDGGVSAKRRGQKEGTCFAFRVPTRYGKDLKN